jgi:hypothetical protein
MNEFLNPKATLTPGALGALMMLLANTICQFFPEAPFRYVALLLSCVIATVSFSNMKLGIVKNFTLLILNTLVIFSVGVGSSNIAANASSSTEHHVDLSVLMKQIAELKTPPAAVQTAKEPEGKPTVEEPVSIGGSIREPEPPPRVPHEGDDNDTIQGKSAVAGYTAATPSMFNTFFKKW